MEAQKSASKRTLTLFYGQIQTQDLQKFTQGLSLVAPCHKLNAQLKTWTKNIKTIFLNELTQFDPGVGPKAGYCSQTSRNNIDLPIGSRDFYMSGKLQKASG